MDGFGVEVLDEALKLLADQVRDDLLEHACARVSARQVTQESKRRSAAPDAPRAAARKNAGRKG